MGSASSYSNIRFMLEQSHRPEFTLFTEIPVCESPLCVTEVVCIPNMVIKGYRMVSFGLKALAKFGVCTNCSQKNDTMSVCLLVL